MLKLLVFCLYLRYLPSSYFKLVVVAAYLKSITTVSRVNPGSCFSVLPHEAKLLEANDS